MKLRLQSDGRTFDLKDLQRLGSGGEAHVYAVVGTPLAAKIYHSHVNGRDDKLRVMLANPPKDPTIAQGHVAIAWPKDLLIDQHGRIVGYVMPLVEQMRRMIDFYNPKTRRKECPLFTYKYLATTAMNLSIAVRALHQRGYVMGDVNESNILVAETTMVTLVDTDSFQVREPGNGKIHCCTVGSPLFTPREMQGVDFSAVERREEQDLFGLGVLLFQLLMEGSHPFQARYTGAGDSPEPVEVIRHGHFPHGTGSAMWQPPPMAPPFGMLDPRLRYLFTRCFVNGHRDPKARPSADEWCLNLSGAIGIQVQCKANPSHLYWPHVKDCPWCERTAKLRGRDPFPHPDQARSGVSPVPNTSQVRSPVSPPVTAAALVPPAIAPTQAFAFPWWRRIWRTSPATPVRPPPIASNPTPPPVRPAPNPAQSPTPTPPRNPIAAPVHAFTAQRGEPLAGSTAKKLSQAKAGYLRWADIGGGIALELCAIPAGSFSMGGREQDETPHQVTLTKPFWLGRTQVTQRQWRALMGSNPSIFSGKEQNPVENVSWDDAMEFCSKLNSKKILPLGWQWSLPTEAQWEYACRAGTTGDYAGRLEEMAWSSNCKGNSTYARGTQPVAEKMQNKWGLYDMHGNVWEWCANWHENYPNGALTDPTGGGIGTKRINRGGSWDNHGGRCRSAARCWNSPDYRDCILGFRVAIVPVI